MICPIVTLSDYPENRIKSKICVFDFGFMTKDNRTDGFIAQDCMQVSDWEPSLPPETEKPSKIKM